MGGLPSIKNNSYFLPRYSLNTQKILEHDRIHNFINFQTMALCLSCISRSLDCVPRSFVNACSIIEGTLPSHINPVGGSVLLQMLVTVTYEEIQKWADEEVEKEKEGERHLVLLM